METLNLNKLSEILKAKNDIVYPKSKVLSRKLGAASILAFSDLLFILVSMTLSLLVNTVFAGTPNYTFYVPVLTISLPLFLVAFYIRGLYPGFGVDKIEELRSLTYGTTVVYTILSMATFFIPDVTGIARLAFISSWILSLISIPLGRAIVRKLFSRKNWWGIPVIVIGAGKAGERIIDSLQKQPNIGLRPLVAVDDDIDRWGYIHGVPVVGGLDILPDLAKKLAWITQSSLCLKYQALANKKL